MLSELLPRKQEDKSMEHYLGKEIPKLGFGLMRLPKNGEEIDVEQTKEMVDLFLEAGFNYFDTSWIHRFRSRCKRGPGEAPSP